MVARGGNDNKGTGPVPSLSSSSNSDANFEFTESGPIVADEDHYNIEIKVSRFNRTINVIQGYQGKVVATSSFSNNEPAFLDFLAALDRAGYTRKAATRFETEAGLCPLNRRYVFKSNQFGEDFRTWTTSCRERGSFGGDFNTISQLFRDQIPEYGQFISNTKSSTGLSL